MTEHPILESFLIRVYRIDTEDCRKIAGLVAAMDGSGEFAPFTDLETLGAIVNRYIKEVRKERKNDVKAHGS
jgi:hypothetical protein